MQTHRSWRDQFRAYRMWILERPGAAPGIPAGGPPAEGGIEYTFLDRHARRDWICRYSGTADWPQYQVALACEHDLVVASARGEMLGWAWLGSERVHLAPLGRTIHLERGTAYLYDAYVRPEHRGRGIGRGLVRARCERADREGRERLLTHVLLGNEPSLRALHAAGFRVLGRTLFVRALVLRMWMRAPLPPAQSRLVPSDASM